MGVGVGGWGGVGVCVCVCKCERACKVFPLCIQVKTRLTSLTILTVCSEHWCRILVKMRPGSVSFINLTIINQVISRYLQRMCFFGVDSQQNEVLAPFKKKQM